MSALRASTCLTVLALLLTGCGDDAEAPTGTSEAGVVEYVSDGDTLRLRDGRRIRLLQIDAPEKLEQCYGLQATGALSRLAPEGTQVRLVADQRLDRRDSFGRLLRYVFAEGRNVNLELVRAGAASPYLFRNERGRYADALLEAARSARAAELGYWGACPRARLEPGLGAVTGPPR